MKYQLKFLATAIALIVGLVVCPVSNSTAQDAGEDIQIEIVNQDGEKVKASELDVVIPKRIRVKGGAGVSVQQKDGTIVITEADGTKREVDVEGAQSIIVNQSVKSVVENGEEKTETFGKAIIIGPDGQRQEIELGGPMQGDLNFPGFDGVFKVDRVANTFMIGVNCEPVGEALRAQLDLESDTGLVVLNVNTGSPAESAGVQRHDILMFADDRQLGKPSDLVEAVQTAGKEKAKISLTLIRAGKEKGVEVSPIERPANGFGGFAHPRMLFKAFPEIQGNDFKMKFRQMGPGLIIDDVEKVFQKEMEDQMKEMQNHMKQLQKQMEDQIKGNDIN